MKDRYYREAFESFSELHPIEAYALNPKMFMKYFRKRFKDYINLPDDELKKIIEQVILEIENQIV